MEEEVAAQHIDPSVQRMNSDGSPLVSSGVSSQGSRKSHHSAEPSPVFNAAATVYVCNHPNCRSVLKTLKGFQNHTFLHNISDANLKKPDMHFIMSCISTFISDVFQEILAEPDLPEEKKIVVENMVASEGSANFLWFCESLSEIISVPILERTKLLPSNQYEEVLSSVNHSLNNEEKFETLKVQACFLIDDVNLHSSGYLRNVLFRLCFRLCELVQILILQEMKQQKSDSDQPATVEVFQNAEEKDAFELQMQKLFKVYYTKAQSVNTQVWNARCLCLRKKFFYCGDDDFVTSSMILDTAAWKDGSVKISKTALDVFIGIETVISLVYLKNKQLTSEIVMNNILNRPDILTTWHKLTSGYLSESDALVFMRDVVMMLSDLSIRLEENRLKIQEQEKKKMPKFSLRSHLKKN